MQREHISIPKLIAYVLFSVIIFALQTGTFGGMRISALRSICCPHSSRQPRCSAARRRRLLSA